MKNALLSVYHKEGIVEFAKALVELDFTIYASGGTFKHLTGNGIAALPVSDLVGGEAILGHRVVTLSREVHAGLLAKNTEEDIAELENLAIPRLDLVCVDLYPLEEEIAKPHSTRESVIEQTDIGGPTMIRSGAKGGRIVVCDPKDRQKVIAWLKAGEPANGFVDELCAKGEFTIARYCMASATYLSGGKYSGFFGERVATCKYGENAWQAPAHLYSAGTSDPLALDKFAVIEGTPPSFNNWCDIDRLLQTATHIAEVFAINRNSEKAISVGVKHGNPCGTATIGTGLPETELTAVVGSNQAETLKKMTTGDPLAIFGGLVMTNFEVDEALCETLIGKMLDGIIAPAFTESAVAILRRKGDKCRFVANPALNGLVGNLDRTPRFRYVRGGFLVQPNYTFVPDFCRREIMKYGKATSAQECDMMLAWAIGSTSNSNTITLVKNEQLIGNGVGQQDRVGAANLAITRAHRSGHDVTGAAAYSDSFFPFPDGPQTLIDAGVTAIFTSSGSIKDQATIDLCAKHGVVLYMVPDQVGRGFFGH
jgi:phosphoribosylaminoimidazolecarboxamide formyltransferase/IMP cyclohydrolase